MTGFFSSCFSLAGVDINGANSSDSGAKTGKLKLYLETNRGYFMTGETVLSLNESEP